MDTQAFVHKRKKRYMAQTLSEVERLIGGRVSPELEEEVKGIIRRKFHALALDACEVMSLKPGEEMNAAVVELRDRLHVEGRPAGRLRRAATP